MNKEQLLQLLGSIKNIIENEFDNIEEDSTAFQNGSASNSYNYLEGIIDAINLCPEIKTQKPSRQDGFPMNHIGIRDGSSVGMKNDTTFGPTDDSSCEGVFDAISSIKNGYSV